MKRILFEEGYKPREIRSVRLKDILLYKQVQQRRQWRRHREFVGLRNDIRGLMDAELIELGGSDGRDEEAIEALEERWSDWIDAHTNDEE